MIRWLRVFAVRLRGLACRHPDDAFDGEMRTQLDLLAERYIRQGMTHSDARAAARRQFGNPTLLLEDRRHMQTITSLEIFWRDLRYGLRQLRSNPLFTAVAVLFLGPGRWIS